MHSSDGFNRREVITQGLAIYLHEGAARAWVFMTYHSVPSKEVAELLAEAGRRTNDLFASTRANVGGASLKG